MTTGQRPGRSAGYDSKDIRAQLVDQVEDLARYLLGDNENRRLSDRNTLRWGSHGSFALRISGSKRGLWHDKEADKGGDVFGLIRRQTALADFVEVLDWAADWLGLPAKADRTERSEEARARAAAESARREAEREEKRRLDDEEAERERQESIAYAARIWSEAGPISGTLGERYLASRGLILAPSVLARGDLRFHLCCPTKGGRLPAIVTAMRNVTSGDVTGAHRIFLTPDGTKIDRKMLGVTSGTAMMLADPAEGHLAVAEGIENALAAMMLGGAAAWAAGSAGLVRSLSLIPGIRRLEIWPDIDAPKPGEQFGVGLSAALDLGGRYSAAGIDVSLFIPKVPEGVKADANDVLRSAGTDKPIDLTVIRIPPIPQANSADRAAAILRERVGAFFDAAADHWQAVKDEAAESEDPVAGPFLNLNKPKTVEPPVHVVQAQTGAGKTHATVATVRAFLSADGARRKGSRRTVAIGAPTTRLCDQVAEDLREAGADDVRVWRGRNQPDPQAPGETMCRDLDAVGLALSAGLNVATACCSHKPKDGPAVECPFFSTCGYQRQRAGAKEVGVWVVPHASLFVGGADLPDFDALVIDESVWQGAVPDRPTVVTFDSFRKAPKIFGKSGLDLSAMNDLEVERAKLVRALEDNGPGPLRRSVLDAHQITAELASKARNLEYDRIRRVEKLMTPGQSPKRRNEVKVLLEDYGSPTRDAAIWGGVADFLRTVADLSGNAWVRIKATESGGVAEFCVRRCRQMQERWQSTPALLLDATPPANELLAPLFPGVTVHRTPPIDVAHAAGTRVVQFVGAPTAASRLGIVAGGPPKPANVADVARFVKAVALKHWPHKVAVVAQKGALDLLTATVLPSNVELRNFGALRGLNAWSDAPALIIIGRPLPSILEVEAVAGVLTGEHVQAKEADQFNRRFFDRKRVVLSARDGTTETIDELSHPHPVADAVLRGTCHAEVIQAIGRVRLVRNAGAEVYILNDLVLGLRLDTVAGWSKVLAGMDRRVDMIARGFFPGSPTDAARLYPELFPTTSAAKMAGFSWDIAAAEVGQFSLLGVTYKRKLTHLAKVTYRPAGAGQRPRHALWHPGILPDPRPVLEAALGPLAHFETKTDQPSSAADPGAAPRGFTHPAGAEELRKC